MDKLLLQLSYGKQGDGLGERKAQPSQRGRNVSRGGEVSDYRQMKAEQHHRAITGETQLLQTAGGL